MTDPRRALEWVIGLPAVTFLSGEDGDNGEARIHVETKASTACCPSCGVVARVKDRSRVELVDLPAFGRPVRLVWHKRRWRCAEGDCANGSWTEEDHRIAAPRQVLTARAARWATVQVGRRARSVNEVADELGCDWHTVNDTVVAYGEALLETDEGRIGEVTALGLDEVLMVRLGPLHRQHFTTSSSTSPAASSWTSSPAGEVRSRWGGSRRRGRPSGPGSSTAPSTSPAPTGASSR